MWCTGDIVEYCAEGIVNFMERARPALRLNGRFIDAQTIESTLRKIPGVDNVYLLVVARPEATELEDFYAFVAGTLVKTIEIEAALLQLPADVPKPRVMTCETLPVNALGKPDRAEMEKIARKGSR
ncbi:hypothetical protein Srufu_020100 [Streptomyces libani subsp. rufus]|nr:hypothetical protein Srufu_020100 [Streptomyces libani subsp. rufus]